MHKTRSTFRTPPNTLCYLLTLAWSDFYKMTIILIKKNARSRWSNGELKRFYTMTMNVYASASFRNKLLPRCWTTFSDFNACKSGFMVGCEAAAEIQSDDRWIKTLQARNSRMLLLVLLLTKKSLAA